MDSALAVLHDAVETGLPYTIAFLGVWMVFRLQRDFDLTVDGSFTLGAAVFAAWVIRGGPALIGVLMAIVAGMCSGLATYTIMRTLRLTLVMASIIVNVGLFTVNLAVMGQANVNLFGTPNLVTSWAHTFTGGDPDAASLELFALIVLIVFSGAAYFLRTEYGLALRASGISKPMIRSYGGSPQAFLMFSVVAGNSLVALSGSLVAQAQGFVDVSMGVGTIVFGVTAVLLGEMVLFAQRSPTRGVIAVVVGALLYRVILATCFRIGIPPDYFQGLTAAVVIIVLFIRFVLSETGKRFRRGVWTESGRLVPATAAVETPRQERASTKD